MLINVFNKSDKAAIFVETNSEYKGKLYTHVRQWYRKADGDWNRSGNGFTVPNDPAELRRLGENLVKVADKMEKAE